MSDLSLENKPLFFYRGLDVTDLRSCDEEEINEINERGYDVYWCLQQFRESRRIKENLQKINYVNCDFDNIGIKEFADKIKFCPRPTMLIKTRSGFHAYWKLRTDSHSPTADQYREFVGEKIVPIGADANAKDACRILRVPGLRYWQDSKGNRYEDQEIRCELIYDNGPEWEWEQLQRLFPRWNSVVASRSTIHNRGPSGDAGYGNLFWKRCNEVDPMGGILKLSGSEYVKKEILTFKPEGKIKRMYVNGLPSNGWIDPVGRFGSTYEKTAGSLVNFLMFPNYGHDMKTIAKIFKGVFNVQEA